MQDSLSVNSSRLGRRLEETALYGATANGGITRLALSEEDGAVRRYLVNAAQMRGFEVQVDPIGNIFITRPGTDPTLGHILIGSHLDTQPQGGKYDGIYGVLAGLEVLESLEDSATETLRSITLVNWTNEEGSRFGPSMMGSAVWARKLDLARALAITDDAGVTVGQALAAIGFAGTYASSELPVWRAFELHIEQGPLLEASNTDIGVVTGVQGLTWLDIEFTGRSAHSGTTAHEFRHDALVAASHLITSIAALPTEIIPDLRATVGKLEVAPNSRNVIPGQARLAVDLRHPSSEILATAEQRITEQAAAIASLTGTHVAIHKILQKPAVEFDVRNTSLIENGARQHNFSTRRLISGAGHDSAFTQEVAPTGMIFIPCVDGISHAEDERITTRWSANGLRVLAQVIYAASFETGQGAPAHHE